MLGELLIALVSAAAGAITTYLIERYRHKLRKMTKYHESQFDLYKTLWDSLYDLRLAADKLWEVANVKNLKMFVEQLQKTEDMVNRNTLLIEENHTRELKSLIDAFWKFDVGKKRLITLRKNEKLYSDVRRSMIERVIEDNRKVRERYTQLIEEIASSMKRQLRAQ